MYSGELEIDVISQVAMACFWSGGYQRQGGHVCMYCKYNKIYHSNGAMGDFKSAATLAAL